MYEAFIRRPSTVVIREGSERHSAHGPLDRESRTMSRSGAPEWCHQWRLRHYCLTWRAKHHDLALPNATQNEISSDTQNLLRDDRWLAFTTYCQKPGLWSNSRRFRTRFRRCEPFVFVEPFFQLCSRIDYSLVFSISADIHLKDLLMPFIVTIALRWFSCQIL